MPKMEFSIRRKPVGSKLVSSRTSISPDTIEAIDFGNFSIEALLPKDGKDNITTSSRSLDLDQQQSLQQSYPISEPKGGKHKYWNPIWLHWLVLLAFAITFAILFIVLIILYHLSKENHGLGVQVISNHYAWTYGPTALLTIVVALWNRVDYYCKTLRPWELFKTRSDIKRAILLDYMSPVFPNVLIRAIGAGDWAVVASALGTLVLRLIIIFSTGLLVLQPFTLTRDSATVLVTSSFNGSKYADTKNTGLPSLLYYGILKQQNQYPFGSSKLAAYDTIDGTGYPSQTTLETTVDGFYPDFQCTSQQSDYMLFWNVSDIGHNASVMTGATSNQLNILASIATGCGTPVARFALCDPWWQNCPKNSIIAIANESVSLWCDSTWMIIVGEVDYQHVPGAPSVTTSNTSLTIMEWKVDLKWLSVISCRSTYSMRPTTIVVDVDQETDGGVKSVQSTTDTSNQSLPGLTYRNLSSYFHFELGSTTFPTPDSLDSSDPNTDVGLLSMMLAQAGDVSLSAFRNANLMATAANEVFRGVMIQMAHINLRDSTISHKTGGSFTYIENRLNVGILEVWLMGIGFIIMLFLSISVWILRPHRSVIRNPNLIGGQAVLLRSHKLLNNLFWRTGSLSDHQLAHHILQSPLLEEETELAEIGRSPEQRHAELEPNFTWWRPIPTRASFMIMSISLPVLMIVALAILKHFSDSNKGLISIKIDISLAQSAATYVSAFVVISISLMYHSIDFTSTVLAPYSALKKGSARAKNGIMNNLTGQLPGIATIRSASEGQYLVTISSIAAILGSFLSIGVSGLFTIQPSTRNSLFNVQSTDTFGHFWSHQRDTAVGQQITLVDYANASYPMSTYDELAFPTLEPANPYDLSDTYDTLKIQLPVRRADLNCTIVPLDQISLSWHLEEEFNLWGIRYNAVPQLPSGCLYTNSSGRRTPSYQYIATYSVVPGGANPDNGVTFTFGGSLSMNLNTTSNSRSCPTIIGYAAVTTFEGSSSTVTQTNIMCSQSVHEVDAMATFKLPGLAIDSSQPPVVDESTIRDSIFLDYNATTSEEAADPFDFGLPESNVFEMSGFWTNLLINQGISLASLVGPSNHDRFLTAYNHEYRRLMAQVANYEMRENLTRKDIRTFTGKAFERPKMRLVQHSVSTIFLQVLLGIMFICAILIYLFTKSKATLPHNPCSMAGSLSLLAGSELCDPEGILPEDAEQLSDHQLTQILDGWFFSLGWWNTKTMGNQRRFGIDIGKADSIGEEKKLTR